MKRIKYLISMGGKHWLGDERGSFTIEASFVIPIFMAMVLLFVVYGSYLYQRTVVYYTASSIAERAAYSWDNSYRNPSNGALPEPLYDRLYWRMGSDGALGSLFGTGWNGESAGMQLPADIQDYKGGNMGLGSRKLALAADSLFSSGVSLSGETAVVNAGLSRYVEVNLKKPLELGNGESPRDWGDPAGAGRGYLVDPVEFIRSVDLIRYYTSKFMRSPEGDEHGKSNAAKVLSSYGD